MLWFLLSQLITLMNEKCHPRLRFINHSYTVAIVKVLYTLSRSYFYTFNEVDYLISLNLYVDSVLVIHHSGLSFAHLSALGLIRLCM